MLVQEKLNEAERIARTAFLIFSNQSGANRIPAEMLGQISDIYFLILIELHYPRNLIQERIEMIHEGNDPGLCQPRGHKPPRLHGPTICGT